MESKVIFISGIDTNVRKTYATGVLARSLAAQGKTVITQKMIQTGYESISEDIEMHRRLMGIPLLYEDLDGTTCPYLFHYPCSPHMAAGMEGKKIDPAYITVKTNLLKERYNYVLLEGAGGLMVPLDFKRLTIDFVVAEHYPLVLVTSGKLGSINHTLLSLFACREYGMQVPAIIYNRYPQVDKTIEDNTFEYLKHYISNNCPDTQLLILPEETEDSKTVLEDLWF